MFPTYPYEPGVIPNDWRNTIVGNIAGDPPDNTIGVDGNYFLDLSNSTVWGPKGTPTEGAWPSPAVTLGNGSNAIVGSTNGVVPNNTIGIDGDYFIDISTSVVFGPKASGVWPEPGIPLGGTANTLFGNSAGGPPSVLLGVPGDYFWDVSTSRWYGPKTTTWPTTPTPVAGGVNLIFGPSNGVPSNTIGIVGSYFFDTVRLEYYGPKAVSGWGASRGFLVPSQVANLANMVAGRSSGTPPSNAVGTDGNYFFDTDSGNVYGPKAGGVWPVTPAYSPSMSAADGNTLTGQSLGAPLNSLGNDGDYFYNTVDLKLYGPKAAGVWPPTGLDLTEANTLTGDSGGSAPSNSLGLNADYFIDTTDGSIYGPKAAGAWPATPAYRPSLIPRATTGFPIGSIGGFSFVSGFGPITGEICQVTSVFSSGGYTDVSLTPLALAYSAGILLTGGFVITVKDEWVGGFEVGRQWQVISVTAGSTVGGSTIDANVAMQRIL